jgi:hypothetical protein
MRPTAQATTPSIAGALTLTSSHALTCDAYLFTSQPTANEAPARRLALLGGTYSDDIARAYARGYELRVVDPLTDIAPGCWVQVRLGAAGQTRDIYTLPTLFVSSALAAGEGTQVTCVDIGACLDELVYERDQTLTGTLQSLAAALTSGVPTLTHPPDVSRVPALAIPANTVAEFGQGRWQVLLSVADQLGVDLLWSDSGDLLGVVRTAPAPVPVARLDDYLVDPGQAERNRPVVRAVVLVARDKALPELVGVATAGSTNGVTIWDRQDGDATTTQAQADALAAGLLARRRSERNVREIDVAPAPWLESGTDTITLAGQAWWVRAMSVELPSLATRLTLRDAS